MYASLRCIACGHAMSADEHYACPRCGGELDCRYDLDRIRRDGAFQRSWSTDASIAEAFAPLLPLADPAGAISLGEGRTPLIRSRRLAQRLGLDALWFKLESSNPTGSFKDRQVAIGMAKAREFGRTRFATVSSGNVGVALAAYAARADAEAFVWVSRETPEAKLQQIQVFGARLFMLPSPVESGGPDAYFGAVQRLPEFCLRHGIVPMISARPANPYMVEGAKTIAYEMMRALGRAPDLVILPAGGGGLVGGVFKGFEELAALGLADAPPRLLAAQRGAYFAPIDDLDAPQYRSGYYRPLDGHWAWRSIQRSRGTLTHVTDDAIRHAQRVLAEEEGIFAEPHGTYSVAALLAAAQDGRIARDALAVCIVSGHGLKDMVAAGEVIAEARYPPPVDVAALEDSVLPAPA